MKVKLTTYRKTIPYTDNIRKVVENGSLVLQRGQWVQLPWLKEPSRWVGLRSTGSVWMTHSHDTMDKFKTMCKSFKGN